MNPALEQKQRAIDWACYPVRKIEAGDGKYHLINGNTGRIISEVSKRYELVPNEKVLRPFVEQFGLENLKRFFQYGNGKYTYAEFNTGRAFNLGTDEAPDIVDERLIVQNSYNADNKPIMPITTLPMAVELSRFSLTDKKSISSALNVSIMP